MHSPGRGAALPFRPLATALSGDQAAVRWFWDGFLAPGALTLLAGKPKAGKSTLTFGLMRALAEAESFLGRGVRRSSVLLLSEERPATLAEKAHSSLMESVHVLLWHEARRVPWTRVIAQAATYCGEQGIGVLVIDTWDKWSGLRGDDESRSGHVLTALEPVMEAAGHGLAVLIVAHHRKAAGQAGDAVRGSNALTGTVDIIVEVERPHGSTGGSTIRTLRALSRYAHTPEETRVDFLDGSYQALEEGASTLRLERDRRLVLTRVQETPGLTSLALSEALEMSDATVRRRLDELLDRGLVQRSGSGRRGSPSLWYPGSDCTTEGSDGGANETDAEAA